MTYNGYTSVKYDGYGTLKLPGSTHYNVFRTISKDSASTGQMVYHYEWFDDTRSLLSLDFSDNVPIAITKFLNNNSIPASGITQTQVISKVLNVYPNPGQGHFNIALPAGFATGYLEVTNTLGQLVITKKIDTGHPDLYIEDKGMYIVTIYSGKEKYSRKVVVN